MRIGPVSEGSTEEASLFNSEQQARRGAWHCVRAKLTIRSNGGGRALGRSRREVTVLALWVGAYPVAPREVESQNTSAARAFRRVASKERSLIQVAGSGCPLRPHRSTTCR